MELIKDGDRITAERRVVIRVGGVAVERLQSFCERIEKLKEERDAISADIREVFGEAKGEGFDLPTLRAILKMRSVEVSVREERMALLDTYMNALGMLPLFDEPEDGQ